jgi:Protein of unknown function (DUF2752)
MDLMSPAVPTGVVDSAASDPYRGDPYRAAAPYPPYRYAEPQYGRFTGFMVRLIDRAPRWVGPLLASGGMGLGVAYTFLVHPTAVQSGLHTTCIVRMLTGFDCPGCGGTRAAYFLMHGDIAEAARYHAPMVFAAPFLAYMFVAWALQTAFGWRVPQLRVSTRSIMLFMAAWSIFSVARNLPWAPFTSLYV